MNIEPYYVPFIDHKEDYLDLDEYIKSNNGYLNYMCIDNKSHTNFISNVNIKMTFMAGTNFRAPEPPCEDDIVRMGSQLFSVVDTHYSTEIGRQYDGMNFDGTNDYTDITYYMYTLVLRPIRKVKVTCTAVPV